MSDSQPTYASQSVPYTEPDRSGGMKYDCPARFCNLDNHDECWRDYQRQEDEAKYSRH